MKKLLLVLLPIIMYLATYAQEPLYNKVFFANSLMKESYFYSEVTYTTPSWIKNVNHKFPVNSELFYSPGNALELNYISADKGKWEARILYRPSRGVDFFTPATHLSFRLRVQSSQTEPVELPQVSIGNRKKEDMTFVPLQSFVTAFRHNHWLNVQIPLRVFSLSRQEDIKDLDLIVLKQQANDGKEHKLIIDQVELLPERQQAPITSIPRLTSAKGYEKHVDITWNKIEDTSVQYIKVYRSPDNKSFYPVGIQSPFIWRYTDYTDTTGKKFYYRISLLDHSYKESPFSNIVSASTRPMTDEQLLDMVQETNFRYYWEGAEPNSGLALENIHGRRNMIASGASGFGIMALIAGTERKFITRQQAIERFDRITRFLESADEFHGAFAHFMDGKTGNVEPFFGERDNGGDLVETSFLVQGLLAARQYFNANNEKEKVIRERIDKIWRDIEWDWYRKEQDSKFLFWHWSPDKEWVINHKLIGWNETMITYILAICSPTHAVPASLYYTGWASQEKEAQNYRSAWGQTKEGSEYTNGNTYYGIPLKVGVSNGGPLFFVHYSFLGLDPHQMKDAYTDYFSNNRNIALINYRYCIENPQKHEGYGADAWGLTASDGLWDYSADEPVPHADHGKITPTGALASFPYTPKESMDALKNYYRNYGKFLWGEYGFRDAFNLDEDWCSGIFMGLNQAPVTVMIENYRTGLLWKLFMSCPEIQNGLKKLALETPKPK
jgi:exo beta-1,2-glucooligosaccharide sophorohydrolase (non-reducing end)